MLKSRTRMLPTKNTKEQENSFLGKKKFQLQMTKPQKIKFLGGIWIICWGKKPKSQTKLYIAC